MSIHTFGDSHSSNIISGWNKNIKSHHLGPILCYSFGKDHLKRCDIRNYNIKNNDTLIFCFGELDCRCHVNKHITNEITYQTIIENLIENYVNAIKKNISKVNIKLKNICIYNVVPPIKKENIYRDSKYPCIGTNEERKSYVLYFNQLAKQKCIENDWIFFDIYDKYTTKDGFLEHKYSDGNIHIYDGKYINEFIQKYL